MNTRIRKMNEAILAGKAEEKRKTQNHMMNRKHTLCH